MIVVLIITEVTITVALLRFPAHDELGMSSDVIPE